MDAELRDYVEDQSLDVSVSLRMEAQDSLAWFCPEHRENLERDVKALRPVFAAQIPLDVPPGSGLGYSPLGLYAASYWSSRPGVTWTSAEILEFFEKLADMHPAYVEGHQYGFCHPEVTLDQALTLSLRWTEANPDGWRASKFAAYYRTRLEHTFLSGIYDGVASYEALVAERLLFPLFEDDDL